MIILFAVILHYSITLQYSAYFHIYFQIAMKYEKLMKTTEFSHLKKDDVLKTWLKGIFTNPFRAISKSNDQGTDIAERPLANLRRKKENL